MLDMHIRPSDLIGIEDAYTAFCFDEVCSYILAEMQDGKEVILRHGEDKDGNTKRYNKPSDLYKRYGN